MASISPSGARIIVRSITFFSSRMLPGHGYCVKQLGGSRGEAGEVLLELRVVLLHHFQRQRDNILTAFAQRRKE